MRTRCRKKQYFLQWNCFLISPGTHVMNTPKAHIWKRIFEKEYEKEKRVRDLEKITKGGEGEHAK